MEVVGLDDDVKYQVSKLTSARLCSNSLGQVYKFAFYYNFFLLSLAQSIKGLK